MNALDLNQILSIVFTLVIIPCLGAATIGL